MAALVNECHGVFSQYSILKTVADQENPEVLDPEPLSENVSSTNGEEWTRKKY